METPTPTTYRVVDFPEQWESPHFPTHVGGFDENAHDGVFVEFNEWVFMVPIPLPDMVRILEHHHYTPVENYILVTKTDAIKALRRLVPAMVQRLAPHVHLHPGHPDYAAVVDAIGTWMRAELPDAMAREIAQRIIQSIDPQVRADNQFLELNFWNELMKDEDYPILDTVQDRVDQALWDGREARGENRSWGEMLRLLGGALDEDEMDSEAETDCDEHQVFEDDDEDDEWVADDQHQEAQDQHQEPPQPKRKPKLINKKVTRRGS